MTHHKSKMPKPIIAWAPVLRTTGEIRICASNKSRAAFREYSNQNPRFRELCRCVRVLITPLPTSKKARKR